MIGRRAALLQTKDAEDEVNLPMGSMARLERLVGRGDGIAWETLFRAVSPASASVEPFAYFGRLATRAPHRKAPAPHSDRSAAPDAATGTRQPVARTRHGGDPSAPGSLLDLLLAAEVLLLALFVFLLLLTT
jgi:hypothetical protein